jgi:hypothetical protein
VRNRVRDTSIPLQHRNLGALELHLCLAVIAAMFSLFIVTSTVDVERTPSSQPPFPASLAIRLSDASCSKPIHDQVAGALVRQLLPWTMVHANSYLGDGEWWGTIVAASRRDDHLYGKKI